MGTAALRAGAKPFDKSLVLWPRDKGLKVDVTHSRDADDINGGEIWRK